MKVTEKVSVPGSAIEPRTFMQATQFNQCNNAINKNALDRQLGGLVVKTFACRIGGPEFDPMVENPTFSRDLHQ